jgi:hypothetical protein
MSRWNVLNTEYPSNSSVDETGKLSIQEALSVIRKIKKKANDFCVQFIIFSFWEGVVLWEIYICLYFHDNLRP